MPATAGDQVATRPADSFPSVRVSGCMDRQNVRTSWLAHRAWFVTVALVTALAWVTVAVQTVHGGEQTAAIHITSPLGRTGTVATVRIVAQVEGAKPASVRFFVDGMSVGTVTDGPPYAVDWVDDNPFEGREIVAEATDAAGHTIRDS